MIHQMASHPLPTDDVFVNYGVADIAAGTIVAVDPTNVISPTVVKDGPGIILAAGEGDVVVGVTMEVIKANGGFGRVRTAGRAVCKAKGAITAGVPVMSTTAGEAKSIGAGKAQVGIALSTSTADGDDVLVQVHPAKNA